jgi:hypothetical protein
VNFCIVRPLFRLRHGRRAALIYRERVAGGRPLTVI